MRRKLPLFAERSVHQMQADRIELADTFARTVVGHKSVTCTVGCSACCHHPLIITVLEAIPLFGSLVEHGHWTPSFKEKLVKNSSLTSGLRFEVWLLSKIPCPVLDKNNRCMGYDERPFMCRATLATGDPYYCDPQRISPETTIAPRGDFPLQFVERESALLKKHGLSHLLMPVSRALLLAERVCNGSLTLESADRTYVAERLADEP